MSRYDVRLDKHATRIRDLEYSVISNGCRVDEADERLFAIKATLGLANEKVTSNENAISNQADRLDNRINRLVDAEKELVECETCGCLLRKGTAVRGESVIEKESLSWTTIAEYFENPSEPAFKESIREVYYCRVHAPECEGCDGECADGGKAECGCA